MVRPSLVLVPLFRPPPPPPPPPSLPDPLNDDEQWRAADQGGPGGARAQPRLRVLQPGGRQPVASPVPAVRRRLGGRHRAPDLLRLPSPHRPPRLRGRVFRRPDPPAQGNRIV